MSICLCNSPFSFIDTYCGSTFSMLHTQHFIAFCFVYTASAFWKNEKKIEYAFWRWILILTHILFSFIQNQMLSNHPHIKKNHMNLSMSCESEIWNEYITYTYYNYNSRACHSNENETYKKKSCRHCYQFNVFFFHFITYSNSSEIHMSLLCDSEI